MKKLLTGLTALFLLSGCSVSNGDILKAQGLCAANGGLSFIGTNFTSTGVRCSNGAEFKFATGFDNATS